MWGVRMGARTVRRWMTVLRENADRQAADELAESVDHRYRKAAREHREEINRERTNVSAYDMWRGPDGEPDLAPVRPRDLRGDLEARRARPDHEDLTPGVGQ